MPDEDNINFTGFDIGQHLHHSGTVRYIFAADTFIGVSIDYFVLALFGPAGKRFALSGKGVTFAGLIKSGNTYIYGNAHA